MNASELHFAEFGFDMFPDVVDSDECDRICHELPATAGAGSRRLLMLPWCQALVGNLRRHHAVSKLLPPGAVAVQCTYFSKCADANWLVAPHQDLGIPVAERVDSSECSGWSEKEGILFVQPPVGVLAQLVALRLHLDDCGTSSGPLMVAPASHKLGRITGNMPKPTHECLSECGGVLALRPLLVHASSRSTDTLQRRVLHFLFGPPTLPLGLRWAQAV